MQIQAEFQIKLQEVANEKAKASEERQRAEALRVAFEADKQTL